MSTDTFTITALSVLTAVNLTISFTSIPLMFDDWKNIPLRPVWKATYDVAVLTALSGTVLALATAATDVVNLPASSNLTGLYILTASSGLILLIMVQPVYWPRWRIRQTLGRVFYKQTPKGGDRPAKHRSKQEKDGDPPPFA